LHSSAEISNPSVETLIRDHIARNLLFSGDEFPYSDDASLLEEGIIDSLGVMDLVTFAQDAFGVPIGQEEVIPEHFDSVRRLAAFVRRKLDSHAAEALRAAAL
jgi:acyl carrier protein